MSDERVKTGIKKVPQRYYPLLAFLAGCTAMFVMLSYSQMLTTGKYTLFIGDMEKLYSYIRMTWGNILRGESIRYSFSCSLGMDTSLILAYDFFSPFNLIYLILYNANPLIAIAIVMILKSGTAAASFQVFLSKGLSVKSSASLIWSVFYTMSGFAVFHALCNNMWADALYLLPLVCLGVIFAEKEGKYLLLILAYAASFIINFYMGYIIGIFSLLAFFLLLFTSKESGKMKVKRSLLYLGSGFLAVFIAAFVWVPALYWIMNQTAGDTGEFSRNIPNIFEVLGRLFWGENTSSYSKFPNLYSGIPVVLLVPSFFYRKDNSLREKIVAGVLVGIYMLGFFVVPLNAFFHAMDIPDGFSYRYVFVLSFLLCAVCALETEKMNFRKLGMAVSGILLYVLYAGTWVYHASLENDYSQWWHLILNACFLAGWAGLFPYSEKMSVVSKDDSGKKKTDVRVLLLVLAMVEAVSNGVIVWNGIDKTPENAYLRFAANMKEVSSDLRKKSDTDFARVIVRNDMYSDTDSQYGFYGLADFGTAEIPAERAFMRNMGFFTSAKLIHASGITPVTEMFLGVKKLYVADNPYKIVGDTEAVRITDNPEALPVGFCVRDDAGDLHLNKNAFENQNNLIAALSGVNGVFEPVEEKRIRFEGDNLEFRKDGNKFVLSPLVNEVPDTNRSLKMVCTDGGKKVYVQTVFAHPGLYFSSPVFEGMQNLINVDDGADNTQLKGSPVAEMGRAESGYILGIASYEDEDLPLIFEELAVYELNEEKLEEAYEILSASPFEPAKVKAGSIRGKVRNNGDTNLLLFTVPYLEGWSAKVNGIEAEVFSAVDSTFLAIVLPGSGEYEVELKYRNPVAKWGYCISLIGLVLLLGGCLIKKVKKMA